MNLILFSMTDDELLDKSSAYRAVNFLVLVYKAKLPIIRPHEIVLSTIWVYLLPQRAYRPYCHTGLTDQNTAVAVQPLQDLMAGVVLSAGPLIGSYSACSCVRLTSARCVQR